jgi:methionine synthase II (cobalamin-independent)
MLYSTDRILTTHAGSLPPPADLRAMVVAKSAGEAFDAAALDRRLGEAVVETVRKQRDSGIDVVNDGELSKYNFTDYVRLRVAGYEARPNSGRRRLSMTARDEVKFADYFATVPRARALGPPTMPVCVAKLRYVGQVELQKDIANFTAALAGVEVAGAFLPANTPGTIEHWIANEYYKSDEEFVFAIADAMHEEYQAIVDAGFLLQIDDPDLPDGWACLPGISIADYRKYATLRVDALNHALRGIPKEKVRLHVCWGSFHGPHHDDIPLRDIHRPDLPGQCRELFDRSLEPVPRARMARLRGGEIARRRDAHPRRRRPLHRFHRAPRSRRRAPRALREARRPRERAGRHRLRTRHPGRPRIDLLGQIRGDGRRRAPRDQDPLGPRVRADFVTQRGNTQVRML